MAYSRDRAYAIQIEGLRKEYHGRTVLNNIKLYVEYSDIAVIMGPNGSGKTTLLKCILGISKCKASKLLVLGERPRSKRFSKIRSKIGYLPEKLALLGDLKTKDYLSLVAELKGCNEMPSLYIDELGLENYMNARIYSLSQGYKRRVMFAAAITCDPTLLILDEPYANIDPETRLVIDNVLARLKWKPTVLITTHIPPSLEKYRLYTLIGGKIFASKEISNQDCIVKMRCENRGEIVLTIRNSVDLATFNNLLHKDNCTVIGCKAKTPESFFIDILKSRTENHSVS